MSTSTSESGGQLLKNFVTNKIEDDLEFRLNDIGRISLRTAAPLCYDPYKMDRSTGSFILVDPFTNETVGAAMII